MCIAIITIFLLLSALNGSFPAGLHQPQRHLSNSKVYVNQNNTEGPWEGTAEHPFQTITTALTKAQAYDEVLIANGVYQETIQINKPIVIRGKNNTILDGQYTSSIITIKSDEVMVHNLSLTHSGGFLHDAAITLQNATNITISNCTMHHNKNAVFINNTSDVLIKNCYFFHNGNAIQIQYTQIISIDSCDFAYNAIGISAKYTKEVSLHYSVFHENGISAFFNHDTYITITQCNISNNSVNKGGLILSDSTMITINETLFYHNGDSISLSRCQEVNIKHCTFLKNTHYAISLRAPSFNINITYSIIREGLRSAIYLEKNNICRISFCNILENYLYSIYAIGAKVNLSNNYWGSTYGPLSPLMLFTNKLSGTRVKLQLIPWDTTPIHTAGAHPSNIPTKRYTTIPQEQPIITLTGTDSDNDGAPDWWEEKWGYSTNIPDDHQHLDPDEDALTNIQEAYMDALGSNPFHKDIFLEIDWMSCPENEDIKPNATWLEKIVDSFAKQSISLHIDVGLSGGGEEIEFSCDETSSYTDLIDLYWDYFLHNNLTNPRKGLFHYGLICYYCPDVNFPFMGWNALDSFAISVQWLEENLPQYQRQQLITGGIIHHLGHTLGLIADSFQAIDNIDTLRIPSIHWLQYLSYKSCMNYFYKFRLFTFSLGFNDPYDFNDWAAMDFSFFQQSQFSTDSSN